MDRILYYDNSKCLTSFLNHLYNDSLLDYLFKTIVKQDSVKCIHNSLITKLIKKKYKYAKENNLTNHDEGIKDYKNIVLELEKSTTTEILDFINKYIILYNELHNAKFRYDGYQFDLRMKAEKKYFDSIVIPDNYTDDYYLNFNNQSKEWKLDLYKFLNDTFKRVIEVCKTKDMKEIERLLIFRVIDDGNKLNNKIYFDYNPVINMDIDQYQDACNVLIKIIGQSVYDFSGIDDLTKICKAAGEKQYEIRSLFEVVTGKPISLL